MESELPGCSAVFVENVKVFVWEKFASIHPRLDCTQAPKNANLLHIADQGHNVKSFEFRVHSVKTANQVFQEQFKSLRQTQHCVPIDHKSGHFLSPVVHQFALIGTGIVARGHGSRWTPVRMPI